ncbi:hypothetical protein BLA29_013136 [Euroglyphus maynei]|uniref:RING-type domain-containing protein n=1 Tax=Euroglyphus maynei TaxID=6958 RepID=A0A1Y3AM94_EURMA|nr:hypothetical protein BLA29_013136 [Euroglyphus maynei]
MNNGENIRSFFNGYCQLDCIICGDKICNKLLHKNRCWALLENCSHYTCISCMKQWRKISQSCPI